MVDFEIPDETKLTRMLVRKFVHDVCMPAEKGVLFFLSSGVVWGSILSQTR